MAAEPAAVTEDAVLGGRLCCASRATGHRVGHDAILLAAATVAAPGDRIIDLGAGVGAAGLAVARRVEVSRLIAGRDRSGAGVAGPRQRGAERIAGRVGAVCLDVASPPAAFAAAGLGPDSADHVLMNPPFNCRGTFASPIPAGGSRMPPTETRCRSGLAPQRGCFAGRAR